MFQKYFKEFLILRSQITISSETQIFINVIWLNIILTLLTLLTFYWLYIHLPSAIK